MYVDFTTAADLGVRDDEDVFAVVTTSLVGEHVMVVVAGAEHLTCLMPVPGDFLLKINPLGGSSLLLCPLESIASAHKRYSGAERMHYVSL